MSFIHATQRQFVLTWLAQQQWMFVIADLGDWYMRSDNS